MIYVNDDIGQIALDEALEQISAQRREQALKYKHDLGRRQCVAAYMLLKEGLRREYGIEENPIFEYGPHGKPIIAGHADIHFNLSHCRQGVICVIGRSPVGVDIESIREYRESLVAYTMNMDEQRQIACSPDHATEFTRLWTMKESLLKLTGRGISSELKNVLTDTRGTYRHSSVVNLQRGYVWSVCEAYETESL